MHPRPPTTQTYPHTHAHVHAQAFEAVCKKLIENMRAPSQQCVEMSMNELCEITGMVAEKVCRAHSESGVTNREVLYQRSD